LTPKLYNLDSSRLQHSNYPNQEPQQSNFAQNAVFPWKVPEMNRKPQPNTTNTGIGRVSNRWHVSKPIRLDLAGLL